MRLQKKNAKPKICVIGPGVVGQATGKVFSHKGFPVSFWGRGSKTVEQLKREGYPAYTLEEMQHVTYDFDVSMLILPTPTIEGKINLDAMWTASAELGKRIRKTNKYHVIVVKSTVPPGTTEDLVIKTVEKHSRKKIGRDFGACMNPEFLREKSAYEDFVNSRLVLIGEYDKKSGDMLELLYGDFNCPIQRVSIKEAEMQKYAHNLFNAVKISFFNEMRQVCTRFGMNAEKIFPAVAKSAEGMWNPEYGTRNFGPFDGMCLPKDTQAFLTWAKEKGVSLPILEGAIQLNSMLLQHDPAAQSVQSNEDRKKNTRVEISISPALDYAV